MSINFRHRCAQSLARAKVELESADPERLKYAALELRMAIEAITYDRAQSYRDELPPSEYETWQPKELMLQLLEIDPMAGMTRRVSMGRQDVMGVPAQKMTLLGTESVFGLALIRKYYDALGSYLHSPTLKTIEKKGEHDLVRMKHKCSVILQRLGVVLSSNFTSNFGAFAEFKCNFRHCGGNIRSRLPKGQAVVIGTCFSCKAMYKIIPDEGSQFQWLPLAEDVQCPTDFCNEIVTIWAHEKKPGNYWECVGCKHKFQLRLSAYEVMTDP